MADESEPSGNGVEYNPHDLLRMDEQEARSTLTVDQYERWEQIQELHDQADETQDEWEEEAEAVADVTVVADMEALGTRVDVFGNDLLVHADPEDPDFRQAAEHLDDEFSDVTGDDVAGEDIDPERADDLAEHLLTMLDTVLVKWDETEWDDLTEAQCESILDETREAWGLSGLFRAWGEIAVAIREDQEEVKDRMNKFRDEERRGNR